MTKVEELLNRAVNVISQEYPEDSQMAYELEMKARKLIDSLIAAAREEGYREGCIEKDAEWRRGYNQGWEERKAFDQPGGALPTVLAPTEPEVKR